MRILIIGGTGVISSAVVARALQDGHDVTVLNRGNHGQEHPEVTYWTGDIHDDTRIDYLLDGQTFDVVANFIIYTPEEAAREVQRFQNRCHQYLFISSTSAYKKPATDWRFTEATPLGNPYWAYSRAKEAAEKVFMEAYFQHGFPITIVRPSHTYGLGKMPTSIHGPKGAVPVIKRIIQKKPILVHGDGTSLWTVTWNEDFARGFNGLFGHPGALGEAFHITADEAMTWNMIYETIGLAVGEKPRLYHITSEEIIKAKPDLRGNLLGDKSISAVFDNTKIKRAVPSFTCQVPFREGARRVIDYLDRHPELWLVEDPEFDQLCDQLMTDDSRFAEVQA